jgi:hypothetical protein
MKEITKKAQDSLIEERTKEYTTKIQNKIKLIHLKIQEIKKIEKEITDLENDYESGKEIDKELDSALSITTGSGSTLGINPLYWLSNC